MTTLSQGTTAPPDRYDLEHAREIALAESTDVQMRRPRFGTVKVFASLDPPVLYGQTSDQLPGDDSELLEQTWKMYERAFTELNRNTVQRHMMYRHEFDEQMADPRQRKFLAFNTDGDVIGLSVYSNNFDALHLISEDYFKTHHPEKHAAKQVWWVGFVAVALEARGMVTFKELIREMFAQHGPAAITGIDYAKVNVDRGLAKIGWKYLRWLCAPLGHDVTCDMVDYQGYHLYTYPEKVEVPA